MNLASIHYNSDDWFLDPFEFRSEPLFWVAVSWRQQRADLLIRGISWPEPDALNITVVNPRADFDSPGASKKEWPKLRPQSTLSTTTSDPLSSFPWAWQSFPWIAPRKR